MRGDDKESIKVSDAEAALVLELDRAGQRGLVCTGTRLRVARRLRERNIVEATSPELPKGGVRFKLTQRGEFVAELRRPKPVTKTDGFGDPIDPHGMYYVQDKRTIVGNCASWWRQDGKGYTCELGEAGAYTGAAVLGMRETDVPWPVNAVQVLAVEHVRVEALRGAVAERRAPGGVE